MATLTPVDHDPFGDQSPPALPEGDLITADVMARLGSASTGPRLTPVDHDPFAKKFNIDWHRPTKDVRADIAKLPEGDRAEALKQWAEASVARERSQVKAMDVPGTVNPMRLPDVIRNTARGTIAGNLLDEALAGGQALLGTAPFDEGMAFQKARNDALDKEELLRSLGPQLIGAFGTGAPIAKGVIAGGKKLAGKTGAVVASGAAGTTAGYVSGFGAGEGSLEQRHEYATSGEGKLFDLSPTEAGAAFGFLLPPAVSATGFALNKLHDAASPALARVGAQLATLPRRVGIHASADGGIPENVGARAAGEQIIANQLARAGKSVEEIRNELGRVDEARRLDSNSFAPNATAIVDLDPSLQRLAGSASRASPKGRQHRDNIHSRTPDWPNAECWTRRARTRGHSHAANDGPAHDG